MPRIRRASSRSARRSDRLEVDQATQHEARRRARRALAVARPARIAAAALGPRCAAAPRPRAAIRRQHDREPSSSVTASAEAWSAIAACRTAGRSSGIAMSGAPPRSRREPVAGGGPAAQQRPERVPAVAGDAAQLGLDAGRAAAAPARRGGTVARWPRRLCRRQLGQVARGKIEARAHDVVDRPAAEQAHRARRSRPTARRARSGRVSAAMTWANATAAPPSAAPISAPRQPPSRRRERADARRRRRRSRRSARRASGAARQPGRDTSSVSTTAIAPT